MWDLSHHRVVSFGTAIRDNKVLAGSNTELYYIIIMLQRMLVTLAARSILCYSIFLPPNNCQCYIPMSIALRILS